MNWQNIYIPIIDLMIVKILMQKKNLKIEYEIDLAVAKLYGISKEELEEFKELIDILSGK